MESKMLRGRSISMMRGFLKEEVYVDFEEKEIEDLAVFYYDLVTSIIKEVEAEEQERINIQVIRDKEAADMKEKGIIDASNATSVDLAGGPKALDNQTIYRG